MDLRCPGHRLFSGLRTLLPSPVGILQEPQITAAWTTPQAGQERWGWRKGCLTELSWVEAPQKKKKQRKEKEKREEREEAVISWACFLGLFKNSQAPGQWWLPCLGGRMMPGRLLVKCLGSVSPRGSGMEEQPPKRRERGLLCPYSGALQTWGRKVDRGEDPDIVALRVPPASRLLPPKSWLFYAVLSSLGEENGMWCQLLGKIYKVLMANLFF